MSRSSSVSDWQIVLCLLFACQLITTLLSIEYLAPGLATFLACIRSRAALKSAAATVVLKHFASANSSLALQTYLIMLVFTTLVYQIPVPVDSNLVCET